MDTTRYADLHVHTFYSDSTCSPEEVISNARDNNLAAIAICDHDCVDGIDPCIDFAKRSRIEVEVIAGVELTAEKDEVEIHMLGYCMDWRDPSFQSRLKKMQAHRVDRIYKMVEKLRGVGIDIDAEKVLARSGRGSVGRLHLAQEMLESRRIRTMEEAFRKYIGFLKPCYVKNIHFTPQEAIEFIAAHKGVPVLAHPYIMNRDDFIGEFVEYGLRGIEVFHTDHPPSVRNHYERVAKEHGLIATGGSDCHGLGKGRILMGGVRVPYSIVEQLKGEALRGEGR